MKNKNLVKNKITLFLRFISVFLLCITLNLPVLAQTEQGEGFEEESFYELEELINTTVTVGSKKKEKVSKTPAIVSVFTADDIANSGYDNLYDLLATVPGVEIIESYYGQTNVLFRGVQQEHFNNKSLILLDGHRIYEQTYGKFHLEQIPLNAIERIEIIRGPGSALYGTNAYTGLVNITTKKDFKTNKVIVKERVGLIYDRGDEKGKVSSYSEVSFRKSIGEDMTINSYASGKWGQPFIYSIPATEKRASPPSRPVSKEYHNHYISNYNSFKWQDLDAKFFFFYNDKSKLGTGAGSHFVGSQEHDDSKYWNIGGNVSYLHELSEMFQIQYKFYADYYDSFIEIGSATNNTTGGASHVDVFYNGYKLIGEVESSLNFNRIYSAIVGLYGEYNHTEPFAGRKGEGGVGTDHSAAIEPFDESRNSYDIAGYLQAKADYEILSLTGGLRYNFNKNYEHSYAPRGGVNLTLYEEEDHGVYLKGLYGFAIRNPSFFEKYTTSTFIKGTENIKPESIHSVDVAVEYVLTNSLAFRTNYFYNSSNNFIERKSFPLADGTPELRYINGSGQEIHGIELDIKYYPLFGKYARFLWMTTNVSWRTGKEKDTKADVNYLTPWLFNFRVDFEQDKYHTGLIFKYVGKRTGVLVNDSQSLCPGCVNEVASYLIINTLFKWRFTQEHEVEVGIHNILDKKFYYPEVVRNKINVVDGVTPFYGGRYYYLAYQYKLGL